MANDEKGLFTDEQDPFTGDAEYDPTPRNDHGVKKRLDGKGDPWAAAHRLGVPSDFLMQDIDVAFGHITFGQNTGERLFLEYVPDDYKNRTKTIRQFAFVAMFDRKASQSAMNANHSTVSQAVYLHMCRVLATAQPRPPKFFYVVGGDEPPWEMYGINIYTGEPNGEDAVVEIEDWLPVWKRLGLEPLRRELCAWLRKPSP